MTIADEFMEYKAAHFWGLRPSEFKESSIDDQAKMFATYIVDKEIEGYYNSESLKLMDAKRKHLNRENSEPKYKVNKNIPRRRLS